MKTQDKDRIISIEPVPGTAPTKVLDGPSKGRFRYGVIYVTADGRRFQSSTSCSRKRDASAELAELAELPKAPTRPMYVWLDDMSGEFIGTTTHYGLGT